MDRILKLTELAQESADRFDVFTPRGPGIGNSVTNDALKHLNSLVIGEFGQHVVQQTLSSENGQSVDFYFEEDRAIVEVEFSLSNPYPSLEKDAFKALLARDSGKPVEKLVIIGDPGSLKKHERPAPKSIVAWLKRHHRLDVAIIELKGRK